MSGTSVCDTLKSLIIDQFFSKRKLRYFGNCSNQISRFPLVKMVRTQRETLSNNFRQEWAFFVQFDYERLLFLPLVLVKRKKIQCQLCRGHHTKRGQCIHETTYEEAIRDESIEIMPYEEQNYDYEEDTERLHQEEYDDFEVDPDNFGGDNPLERGKYLFINVRLPLLPCEGISNQTTRLTAELENSTSGEMLCIEDLCGVCRFCFYKRTNESLGKEKSIFRETKLYTLNQQVPIVQVEDWICPRCGAKVFFTSVGQALFPIRKTYMYTY